MLHQFCVILVCLVLVSASVSDGASSIVVARSGISSKGSTDDVKVNLPFHARKLRLLGIGRSWPRFGSTYAASRTSDAVKPSRVSWMHAFPFFVVVFFL